MRVENRPREECKDWPDIEHLRQVKCSDVIAFITKDNAAVPDDEGNKDANEVQIGRKCIKQFGNAFGPREYLQAARRYRYDGLDVVW